MLRGCLQVSASFKATRDSTRLVVEIEALNVGHGVPTGFVDRNLLLVAEGRDGAGHTLFPQTGPKLTARAGAGMAGLPGKLYAKQLADFQGCGPVPFWRASPHFQDTRLSPGQRERLEFAYPAALAEARVRLIYRRFWKETADAKRWPDTEILVVDKMIKKSSGN
jgi:hypothetical protein